MERNRWESAIRCLELALHPNTADAEVIAGVNGFRRAAAGIPLGEVCRDYAGATPAGDDLSQENLDLRRRLEHQRASQEEALARLREAERVIRDLSDDIRAEQQSFADFRSASARIVDGLKDENFDLRGALEEARLVSDRPARQGNSPFRDLLTGVLLREGQPAPHPARAASPPIAIVAPRHPWTA
ncbi:MAG TPA: hypothetical protein VN808_11905 [Stellaceae bacterium]|nr:hypothetical protein [Stellaceae bacterium]